MADSLIQRAGAAWKRYGLIDGLALARNVLLLWVVWLGLRTVGFRRLRRWCGEFAVGAATADPACAARVARIARLVQVAAAHCPGSVNCLPRSIVLWWLLRRAGEPARFCLGVDPAAELSFAHAWIEWRDTVLIDTPQHTARYTPLPEPGS
jgi:hypothetical protein